MKKACVLEAEQLLSCVYHAAGEQGLRLIRHGDHKGFQKFLEEHLPKTCPRPDAVFVDLGKMYCRWDKETDSFRRMAELIGSFARMRGEV